MIEYAGHAIASIAAVVAIRGNTFNPSNDGIRKITSVGWVALFVVVLGLVVSVLITIQDNSDKARVVQQLNASEEREKKSEEREKELSQQATRLQHKIESLQLDLAATTTKLDNANTSIDELNELLKSSAERELALTAAPSLAFEPYVVRYYEDGDATLTLNNNGGQIIDLSVTDHTMHRVVLIDALDCPEQTFVGEVNLHNNRYVNYYPVQGLTGRTVHHEGRMNFENEELYSIDLLYLYGQSEKLEKEVSEAGEFRPGCIDIQPVLFIKATLKNYSGVEMEWYGNYDFEHYEGIDFRFTRHELSADSWNKVSTHLSNIANRSWPAGADGLALKVLSDIGN